MARFQSGDYSTRQLWRLRAMVGVMFGTVAGLAAAGFSRWQMSLLGFPLAWVLWRETSPKGLLDPSRYVKGRHGHRSVEAVLKTLGDQYRIHHGLEARGGGDIDHVVVGPTGIFAIETKNLAGRWTREHGRLTLNGFDADEYVVQTRKGAMQIRDELRVAGIDRWVEAVLVSAGASVANGCIEDKHVTLIPLAGLRRFITRRKVRLSEADVTAVELALAGMRRRSLDRRRAASRPA